MSINTFFGLQLGRQALQAQQQALEVTGHNIANANTEGYSRQQAIFTTPSPYAMPSYNKPLIAGQMGTGVYIQEIKRVRDDFIDAQVRQENTTTSEWNARQDTIGKLEVILNEPSDSGLRSVMDQFWQSLEDLSKNPEDGSTRAVVLQSAITLTDTFNHLNKQMVDLTSDINTSIKTKVDEINNIASQIGSLNDQIVKVEVSGDNANDLRDKRDLLIDKLSNLVDVSVTEPADQHGAVTITVGGRALVLDTTVNSMVANADASGNYYLKWSDNMTNVNLSSGEIKGLIDARDISINGPNGYKSKLDTLANQFITTFNAQHKAGFGLGGAADTGYNFFTGTDAASIAVDPAILSAGPPPGYNHIAAASAANAPGDGSNAIALADIKNLNIAALSGTVDDFFRGLTGQLGVESQAAQRMVANQELLLSELNNKKQSVSGVSLDEEMTNMIKFQQSYSAAARLVSTMNDMIDTLINKMG